MGQPERDDSPLMGELVKRNSALSRASKVVALGLVIAAAGIVIQIASGVDYPTVPPGLLILLIPAALVFWGHWPWTLIVAALAALFIVVGYFPSGAAVRLLDPTPVGVFVGLWLQFAAGIVTVIAGITAIVQTYRPHSGPERRMRLRRVARVDRVMGPGAGRDRR